ncbi:flagellar hook-basal body complex protein FliE [uncultured Desulfobacter sp.]|uniref:flagellar hook-basal body complex protein FliE n=1 Tax=uncultured Desulfobacter sp. TaxID=240139 RepID=UPI002AABBADE|nr:flagellar hook-basal body complex protein FliE [uncultured Desulfobacter sp.]
MDKIDTQIPGKLSLYRESMADRAAKRSPAFMERLESAILDVNKDQHVADDSVESVIEGKLGIHEGMMALSRASTSLKVLAQVRNKAMSAYDEIMRMQI